MQEEYPIKSLEFVRAISEDDLVALHTHQTWPGNNEYVTMDFLGLMQMEKLLSIGILSNKYLKMQRMKIKCIEK